MTINAADEPLECVLVRSGQEPVVVNLDIEGVEQPQAVEWVDPIHRTRRQVKSGAGTLVVGRGGAAALS